MPRVKKASTKFKSSNAFICDFCGQHEKGKGYLQRHIDSKHRNFICIVCGNSYKQRSNLLTHLRLHFEKFICQYCGLEIRRLHQFQRHVYEQHEPHNTALILSIQLHESYSCRYCIRAFPSAVYRNCHEHSVHKGRKEDPFKCKECNLIFVTKEDLRSHSFEHYSGNLHFCAFPDCDRFFKNVKRLKSHELIHGPAGFECEQCQQRFFQSANWSKHKKRCRGVPKKTNQAVSKEEHEEIARAAKQQFLSMGGKLTPKSKKPEVRNSVAVMQESKQQEESKSDVEYLVEYLDEVDPDSLHFNFKEVRELPTNDQVGDDHEDIMPAKSKLNSSRQRNTFLCHICGHQTSTQADINSHMNDHVESKSRERGECEQTSESRHSRLANKIRKLKRAKVASDVECDICGVMTDRLYKLRMHMRHHVAPTEECELCHQKFRYLAKHMKLHTNLRDFVCEVCNSAFKSSSNLKTHLGTHNEPSECPICHKLVLNIRRHVLYHKQEKPEPDQCPICGKTCANKHVVQEHIQRVHEKKSLGKYYICPVCGLKFIRNLELRRHSYIHYTGRTFHCDYPGCNEVFKKPTRLQAHKMVHNPIKEASFPCQFCDKKYLRQTALYKHQKMAHPKLFEMVSVQVIKNTI